MQASAANDSICLPCVNRLIHTMAQATVAMCAVSIGTLAHSETTPLNCAAELDATVALATNPDNDLAALEARFAALEATCPAFPQLAHNQGVLAARNNRWPQAIKHFERALSKDARAANTHQHLQQIFKYRAAQAYAEVLKTPPSATPPQLVFQDSATRNSDADQNFPEHSQLRDIATVEYELFAWWQARQNEQGLRQHYVDDYNAGAIKLALESPSEIPWQDVKREIAFTENDVAVVISQPSNPSTLLLMRLVGGRWKIYQETRL